MTLPAKILARLQSGRAVATELTPPQHDICAYLLILPLVPHHHSSPERWLTSGTGEPWLRDPNDITGYEIRYLHHHAKYTEEWGWDADLVAPQDAHGAAFRAVSECRSNVCDSAR